jgi:hypothetical protein
VDSIRIVHDGWLAAAAAAAAAAAEPVLFVESELQLSRRLRWL